MPCCRQHINKDLFEQQKQLMMLESQRDSPIFIGAQSGNRASYEKALAGTVDQFLGKEQYKHAVLDPQTHLQQAWEVYLNEAFMEGAICSGRNIKLVTDIGFYTSMLNGNFPAGILNNGTWHELLALQASNFTFTSTTEDNGKIKVLAIPPETSNPNLQNFRDYEEIYTAPKAQKTSLMKAKFEEYRARIDALVKSLNATISLPKQADRLAELSTQIKPLPEVSNDPTETSNSESVVEPDKKNPHTDRKRPASRSPSRSPR
jgi:hypothetical protein